MAAQIASGGGSPPPRFCEAGHPLKAFDGDRPFCPRCKAEKVARDRRARQRMVAVRKRGPRKLRGLK